jgi:hypothetical protein
MSIDMGLGLSKTLPVPSIPFGTANCEMAIRLTQEAYPAGDGWNGGPPCGMVRGTPGDLA